MEASKPITIRDLYPQMSEADLTVAADNLRRYVALVVRMHERLQAEGKAWPASDVGVEAPTSGADLTLSATHPNIARERSNSL